MKKWTLQKLPASLMLRTLKYTKSKLKYMKLSESVKEKLTIKSLIKVYSLFVSFKNSIQTCKN